MHQSQCLQYYYIQGVLRGHWLAQKNHLCEVLSSHYLVKLGEKVVMVAHLFEITPWCLYLHNLSALYHLSLHSGRENHKNLWQRRVEIQIVKLRRQRKMNRTLGSTDSCCHVIDADSVKKSLPHDICKHSWKRCSKWIQFRNENNPTHFLLKYHFFSKSHCFGKLEPLVKDKMLRISLKNISSQIHTRSSRSGCPLLFFSSQIRIHGILRSYADSFCI